MIETIDLKYTSIQVVDTSGIVTYYNVARIHPVTITEITYKIAKGINAQIEIYMSPGTNSASATIYPNFNSNTVWLSGKIVPYENSDVFEGMSL